MSDPYSPLPYQTPYNPPTSAWRTTIGIISIVLASLGILANGCGMIQTLFMNSMFKLMGSLPSTPNGPNPFQSMALDNGTIAIAFFSAACQLGAAILLLIAGIKMLRRAENARKLHLIWAVIKIVAIGVAVISQITMSQAMLQTMGSTMPAGTMPNSAFSGVQLVIGVVTTVLFGIAYPVFILITLNCKAVIDSLAATEISNIPMANQP